MQKEVIDAIPVGRSHQSLAILIPGLSTRPASTPVVQDVGGTNNLRLANAFTIHGGRTSDSNMQLDGFQVRNIGSFANLTNMFPDMGATQEMTIDYAAGTGRGGHWWREDQLHSARGWQLVPGLVLRDGRQLVVPGRQLFRRSARARPDAGQLAAARRTTSTDRLADRSFETSSGSLRRRAGR